ncbi:MAG: GNAT family N-acetyltransferase [Sphingomonas paucimobilis]
MVEIRTERLLIRPARAGDLDAFHAMLSDDRAMAYWYRTPHETIDDTRGWLDAMIDIDPRTGEDFVVEREGRVIGKAGLRRFPTIGYIFHPDAWGQGFATEALRPIIDRAFAVHGLPMIEAEVDPRNLPSLRLLARMGFEPFRYVPRACCVAGTWSDSVFLRLAATA